MLNEIMREINEIKQRLAALWVNSGGGATFARSFQIGNGNDITPSGYSSTLYGVNGIPAAAITSVPTAVVPDSPTAGAYDDGLTWATDLASGAKVWVSTKITVDAVTYTGNPVTLIQNGISISTASYQIPADDTGGNVKIYLLTGA